MSVTVDFFSGLISRGDSNCWQEANGAIRQRPAQRSKRQHMHSDPGHCSASSS